MRFFGTVPLTTKNLYLRRYHINDVPALHKIGSDPKVNQYITFTPCKTLQGTKDFVMINLQEYRNDQSYFGWAITKDDKLVGSIGTYNMDRDNESCEVGYNISSEHWNEGIATESLQAVLKYLFETIQMHKVYASFHVENVASKKVLEKCGMSYEGTAREMIKEKDGSFSDLIYYGITAGEYFGR